MGIAPCVNEVWNHHQRDNEKACQIQKTKLHTTTPLWNYHSTKIKDRHAASGSTAEDLFIDLFSDTFGAEKAGYLYSQYPFYDIYQNNRFADFVLENGPRRVALEIDDEASHNPKLVSSGKFWDDLLKQNSMTGCPSPASGR